MQGDIFGIKNGDVTEIQAFKNIVKWHLQALRINDY